MCDGEDCVCDGGDCVCDGGDCVCDREDYVCDKLQALVYDILPWRKVPESGARSVRV